MFFPVNINNNHWISVWVHFKEKYVQILDSLANSVKPTVENNFTYFLKKINLEGFRFIYDSPKQMNGYRVISMIVPTVVCLH
jgi:Ulp1 family protease